MQSLFKEGYIRMNGPKSLLCRLSKMRFLVFEVEITQEKWFKQLNFLKERVFCSSGMKSFSILSEVLNSHFNPSLLIFKNINFEKAYDASLSWSIHEHRVEGQHKVGDLLHSAITSRMNEFASKHVALLYIPTSSILESAPHFMNELMKLTRLHVTFFFLYG